MYVLCAWCTWPYQLVVVSLLHLQLRHQRTPVAYIHKYTSSVLCACMYVGRTPRHHRNTRSFTIKLKLQDSPNYVHHALGVYHTSLIVHARHLPGERTTHTTPFSVNGHCMVKPLPDVDKEPFLSGLGQERKARLSTVVCMCKSCTSACMGVHRSIRDTK